MDLKQFLTIESPLRMMKNAFYFTLKAVFVNQGMKFGQLIKYKCEKYFSSKAKLLKAFITTLILMAVVFLYLLSLLEVI